MTILRAEDFSPKPEKPKRVPRKQKPRTTKEDRRTGALDLSSLRPVVHLKPRSQAKLEVTPPVPTPKIPSRRLLASIAKKYEFFYKEKAGYRLAKDRRRSPKILATEIASGPFLVTLSKYKGYDPAQLMELVITDLIRVEPKKEPATQEAVVIKEPKGPTKRQLEQIERAKASPPPATTATATTKPKGAPKTIPPRESYTDEQIAEDMLDEFLTAQENLALRAALCAASRVSEIKRLLRSDESIEQLVVKLKQMVASPRRVATYLDVAARVLIPVYNQEQAEAERIAQEKAEERREARTAAAIAKAKVQEEEMRKQARRNKPMTPADWRALNKMS